MSLSKGDYCDGGLAGAVSTVDTEHGYVSAKEFCMLKRLAASLTNTSFEARCEPRIQELFTHLHTLR